MSWDIGTFLKKFCFKILSVSFKLVFLACGKIFRFVTFSVIGETRKGKKASLKKRRPELPLSNGLGETRKGKKAKEKSKTETTEAFDAYLFVLLSDCIETGLVLKA